MPMPEKEITFKSETLTLHGLLEEHPGEKGVVVTHPHPLYGGNMYNHVVDTVCQAFQEREYTCLRFNFRGVGLSEGEHGNGIGEQDDVMAALDYLSALGKKEIDLAGYSFGAWVNARGLGKYSQVKRMIMISPPVNAMDYSFLSYNPKIKLVISGSHDDIAGTQGIKEGMPIWNPEAILKIVDGADHFFGSKTDELKRLIVEFLGDQ
jgi:alpha/beta superfamily hydrolase